jgi:hypothetical protein
MRTSRSGSSVFAADVAPVAMRELESATRQRVIVLVCDPAHLRRTVS